jgi:photosystem II stability/assembly factor-like uncharacterized protein
MFHSPSRPRRTRSLSTLLLATALAVMSVSSPLAAQSSAPALAQVSEQLEFREIGPTIMGGRVSDIDAVESDPATFYVATASGGVWKTTNMGISFEPVFADQSTASIGDVTIAQNDPDVVWVGTGEPQNRQSSPWGDGVYLSTDAGATWRHVGLEDTHHISRIQVDPRDAMTAYVGAVGELWDASEARGVYKTTDGGQSWEKVLYVDDLTGVIDLVMDSNDPNTLFAATYQRQRKAWGFNGGGPGSGIWRTTDGGANWERLANGLPGGDLGRIGLDVWRTNPDYVYALIEAETRGDDGETGVYRSMDGGDTWEHINTENNRPMYYSQIRVDPLDNSRIYLGGTNLYRTNDGGESFTDDASEGVHLDHHALWINPTNPEHLLLGSDGGVSISWDRSDSWFQFRNLPISQFYEVGVDMRIPYHVCGGLQDNGSWCAPSDSWSNEGIRTRHWYHISGGDGFFTEMSTGDPRFLFTESQGGNVSRLDTRTMERLGARPPLPEDADFDGRRFNWNTPILLSEHDPNTVYVGANFLSKSTDLGISWEAISGDNTYAVDRDTLEIMGVPGAEPQRSRNDGQSNYGNITAIAESPVDMNVLYTGADDGRLMVTRDGGASWADITGNVSGVPPFTYVTRIVASNRDAGTAYAAFDGHRDGDFAAHLYRTRDFGQSWEEIEDGLPQNSLNAIAQHHRNADLLFVGNEIGLWMSIDEGDSWTELDAGLPTVPVDDIEIHPRDNDLVLGTHGRGIWIMDDIGGLEVMTPDLVSAEGAGQDAFALAPIAPAYSYNSYGIQQWTAGYYEADNGEDDEALLQMWLSESMAARATNANVEIVDAAGRAIREFEVDELAPGLNRDGWDLRMAMQDADGEWWPAGPRVMPGIYTARVTLQDENGAAVSATAAESFEVILDPRGGLTRAQIMARNDASVESYRLWAAATLAGRALGQVDSALDDVQEALEEEQDPDEDRLEAVREARERIEALDDALGDADAGASVWQNIQRTSVPPEAAWLADIEASWQALPGAVRAVNDWIAIEAGDALELIPEDERPEIAPAPVPTRGGMD